MYPGRFVEIVSSMVIVFDN